MRTVDVDSLLAPYPIGYYSQQCQCTQAQMDQIRSANASNSIQTLYANDMPIYSIAKPSTRRYHGDCRHCGAPANPHKEKCDYCDCYY